MKSQILLAVAAGVLLGAGAPTDDAIKKDAANQELKKLEGTWTLTALVADGKEVAEKDLKDRTLVITGNKFALRMANETVAEGTLKFDPTQKPKALDSLVVDTPE